jgi:hypothetical protein
VDGSDGNLDNGETVQHFFQRLVDPDFEELSRQVPSFGAAWRRAVETDFNACY